jgi:hypothetical protein
MNNPLYEVIPAAARKYVYAVLTLAALVVAGIQAFDGDWLAFSAYLVAALTGATAASNTSTGRP